MRKPMLTIELDILYRIENIRMESSTDIKSEHIIIGIGTIYCFTYLDVWEYAPHPSTFQTFQLF